MSVPAPVSTASPRLIWLLLSLMVAMVLAALDQSIVATALPVIAGELNGVEAMSWVVTLFMLGLSLLLLWAHLGMGAGYFFVTMGILGMGMGIGMPNATVIVQNSVPSRMMGAATASMAFCRSLGGALGVAAAGGIMSYTLGRELAQLPEAFRHLNLLEGLGEALAGPPEQIAQLTELYRGAIQASLSAGGLVMFAAFLLVLSLRWAKAPDSP